VGLPLRCKDLKLDATDTCPGTWAPVAGSHEGAYPIEKPALTSVFLCTIRTEHLRQLMATTSNKKQSPLKTGRVGFKVSSDCDDLLAVFGVGKLYMSTGTAHGPHGVPGRTTTVLLNSGPDVIVSRDREGQVRLGVLMSGYIASFEGLFYMNPSGPSGAISIIFYRTF
jgi:hypothetical protein